MDKKERYHGLDFVRSIAMMLGLAVHVNIFYFSEDRMFWSAGEYHSDPINQFIAFFIFQFRRGPRFLQILPWTSVAADGRLFLSFCLRFRFVKLDAS